MNFKQEIEKIVNAWDAAHIQYDDNGHDNQHNNIEMSDIGVNTHHQHNHVHLGRENPLVLGSKITCPCYTLERALVQ